MPTGLAQIPRIDAGDEETRRGHKPLVPDPGEPFQWSTYVRTRYKGTS
jgi:hypothetical protein